MAAEERNHGHNKRRPPIHYAAWLPSPLASSILADSAKANAPISRQLTASKAFFFPATARMRFANSKMEFARFLRVSLFCPLLQFAPKPALDQPSRQRILLITWPWKKKSRPQTNSNHQSRKSIHLPAWPPSPPKSSILADSAKAILPLGRPTTSKAFFSSQWQGGRL